VLYSVYGGGHTWPGSPLEWPEWAGAVSREINAGQAIIEFFQRHPLPRSIYGIYASTRSSNAVSVLPPIT
jgi:hypothetical protein